MSLGEVRRQTAIKIDEIRWSAELLRELEEKVKAHWAVKKKISGAAAFSFVQ